jgi:hypothetical protein
MTPTERILANEKMDAATRAVVEAAAKRQAAENGSAESKYPIDLPSPILLASSMILAIVSTGKWRGDVVQPLSAVKGKSDVASMRLGVSRSVRP